MKKEPWGGAKPKRHGQRPKDMEIEAEKKAQRERETERHRQTRRQIGER